MAESKAWKLRYAQVRKGNYDVYFETPIRVRAITNRLTNKTTNFENGVIVDIKDECDLIGAKTQCGRIGAKTECESRRLLDTSVCGRITIVDFLYLPDPSGTIQNPFVSERFYFW